MIRSVWLLEYRHRERKNGKWSEWQSSDNSACVVLLRTYPASSICQEDKYQRRAVEYIRKEPAE